MKTAQFRLLHLQFQKIWRCCSNRERRSLCMSRLERKTQLRQRSPSPLIRSHQASVALLILALGRYSGSLVNPAITVAVASAGLLKREMIAPYLFFQILGGVLAGAALKFFFGGLGGSASLFWCDQAFTRGRSKCRDDF